MNETLEQRLSMLLDGETTPFETKRLVDEIDCNPHIKALWLRMNKQRAALKGELIDPNLDISSSVMSHLNSTSQTLSLSNTQTWQFSHFFPTHYIKACCYLLGFFLVLSSPLINLKNFSPSDPLSKITNPSKTFNQNLPLPGNEALLVDLGSNFDGSLKNYRMVSDNAIEANYQLSNDEAVKIKVYFNDISQTERLNLIETGITLHTKAGNEPVVLNVSSDQISNSKLIKISNTFFNK
ncbi:MAG: hypothetical protein CBD82_02310 [Gammaproteobacteria bacterium TMED222]|nr:MAG: hypothetical protein CBD82_02310 [Gammaproteobacteria bacterium TMED222]RZO97675.1 MAG: hypothetical protein EVA49_03055 [Gammaproteobacteria bacterium]|tara:strand:+ start:638 stop:1351 length:714 start_codon:yes stop_codon:yes gene_type:complete